MSDGGGEQEDGRPAPLARLQARAARATAWAEDLRARNGLAAWLWEVVERDRDCGGGLFAGALAYRFFIWLLPFVLVLVGGLGVVSAAASETPGELADSGGFGSLVTSSVSTAARSNARWYALAIGIPILLYTTSTLLRAIMGVHRLVWGTRTVRPRPTPLQILGFLAALVAFPAVSAIGVAARASAFGTGLVVTLLATLAYGALWVLISSWLPHAEAPVEALLPGAALFAVGTEALHVFYAYVLGPLASSRQDAYGSLGVAAALLLGLYFLGRLIVVCAAVNATLWERRRGIGASQV